MERRRKRKDLIGVPKITTYGLRPLESRTANSPSLTSTTQHSEKMAANDNVNSGTGDGQNTATTLAEQGGEPSAMESRILQAIAELTKKTEELKVDMNARLGKIEQTLTANTGKITDLEEGLDFSNKEIDSQKKRLDDLESENKKLRSEAGEDRKTQAVLRERIQEVEDGWKEKLNDMERHSRGYSIRVKNVQLENDSEDSRVSVAKILLSQELVTGDDVGTVAALIEHAHPLGRKREDGRVNLIARFYSRPVRDNIIEKAKLKRYKGKDSLKIVEDMTRMDFQARVRAYPQMQKAYEKGKKARFYKGKLIINGKQVPIE